jgi:hypothetical protein
MTKFLDDRAENSIMQTITIAVSAILIASGLVTAPGLINNARDNNARNDLSNVALAQEFSLSDSGKYSSKVMPGAKNDGSLDELAGGPKYTLSRDAVVTATTCGITPDAYVMTTMSRSGNQFWRVSDNANTYSNEADVRAHLAACLTGVDLGMGNDSGTTTPDDNTWSNDAPVGSYFNRQGNFLGSINPYGQIFVDSPSSKQLEQLKDIEPAVYHVYNPETDLLLKSKPFADTPGEITYEGRVIARFTDSVITEYSNANNTSQANIGIMVNDLYYPELRDIYLSFTGNAKINYPSLNLTVPMMANPDQMAQWNPAGVESNDYTFVRSSGKLSDAANESFVAFDANGMDVSHSSYQFYNMAGLSNSFPASSGTKNTPTDIYYSPTGDSGTFSKVGETKKLVWNPASISQLQLPDLSKYDDAAGTWKLVTHLNGDSYTFMGNMKM